jgi:hypothetical protein
MKHLHENQVCLNCGKVDIPEDVINCPKCGFLLKDDWDGITDPDDLPYYNEYQNQSNMKLLCSFTFEGEDGILKFSSIDCFGFKEDMIAQHLYITSNEKVGKDATWVVRENQEVLNIQDFMSTTMGFREQCKKIIATTDSELGNDGSKIWIQAPQIPESFIIAYIEAFNKKTPITEVNVEYDELIKMRNGVECKFESTDYIINVKVNQATYKLNKQQGFVKRLKLRPDNTIIISPSKTYTREEVIQFGLKAAEALALDKFRTNSFGTSKPSRIHYDKWIEDNL